MGQVIKCWNDFLCSRCYRTLAVNIKNDYNDEPMWCDDCKEHVFPIVIMKREYDTTKAIGAKCQSIERDIKHGIEIIHIDGEGITEDADSYKSIKNDLIKIAEKKK